MKTKIAILIIGTILFTNGCATLMGGKTQTVNVKSNKSKEIQVDGRKYTTPAQIIVKRSSDDKVITVEGCDKNITMKSNVRPLFFGNIIFGGIFGSTTDATNDAMWEYDDDINIDCN
jgi:hypothetical protein